MGTATEKNEVINLQGQERKGFGSQRLMGLER